MTGTLPRVTIVTPVLNDAIKLGRALRSVVAQDYPMDLLEVVVADGGSSDDSRDIAVSYSDRVEVRLLDNSDRRQAAWGKAMAIESARGEVIQLLDADVWFTSPVMLRRLVEPMVEDRTLAGAIAPYAYVPGLSVWTRFLSCDEFQRDPLVQVLTPSIRNFIVESRPGYDVCEFRTTRIPPVGQTTTYWAHEIDLDVWGGLFIEDELPVRLASVGRRRFAFVGDVGFGHEHCSSLSDLVRKRARNLHGMDSSWLFRRASSEFAWIDPMDRHATLRVLRWLIGTHVVVPRIFEGIRDSFRSRHWEPLLRPIVALAVADSLVFQLLRSSDGRELIRDVLRGATH